MLRKMWLKNVLIFYLFFWFDLSVKKGGAVNGFVKYFSRSLKNIGL